MDQNTLAFTDRQNLVDWLRGTAEGRGVVRDAVTSRLQSRQDLIHWLRGTDEGRGILRAAANSKLLCVQHHDRVEVFTDAIVSVKIVTQPRSFSQQGEVTAERIVEGDMGIYFGAIFMPDRKVATLQQQNVSVFDRIGMTALRRQVKTDAELASFILKYLSESNPPEVNDVEF